MKRYKVWRYLGSGPAGGKYNMDRDRDLFQNFNPSKERPVFRIYSWSPPAVSLGKFQKAEDVFDSVNFKKTGIPVVRRLTGGGAIYHGNEITYSMVFPREMIKEYSVKESYRIICGFLIGFYRKLGYKAEYAAVEKNNNSRGESSGLCFKGQEKYDILIDGKKIGGNAQKRTRKKVFQHGSIPLDIDYKQSAFIFKDKTNLETRTFYLKNHDFQQTSEILVESFKEYFNCSFAKFN
ncbi:MAG: lipoate--protein ligase family protein [Elusimicrobia bacterium]|jgi:lipoate-protein ligase A|nr:lipoate--protein ligase family protein [Elusimicrobiota bacterium]